MEPQCAYMERQCVQINHKAEGAENESNGGKHNAVVLSTNGAEAANGSRGGGSSEGVTLAVGQLGVWSPDKCVTLKNGRPSSMRVGHVHARKKHARRKTRVRKTITKSHSVTYSTKRQRQD